MKENSEEMSEIIEKQLLKYQQSHIIVIEEKNQ